MPKQKATNRKIKGYRSPTKKLPIARQSVINAAHCNFNAKDSDGISVPTISSASTGRGVTYNLQGQRITAPTPRQIYIKEGRKYLAK